MSAKGKKKSTIKGMTFVSSEELKQKMKAEGKSIPDKVEFIVLDDGSLVELIN